MEFSCRLAFVSERYTLIRLKQHARKRVLSGFGLGTHCSDSFKLFTGRMEHHGHIVGRNMTVAVN
jgi:hypothetical protein